ncbi:F-box/kelch-repeat protein At3g06240-like [Rutidosis leptorrhynchoides]|uniref:F-box/kelch-repeat protein At3g06240-like n=1 Tax=Rutidosis leptorrhynchoides TaxID=125765 RepID=UPI003A99A9FA
MSDHQHNSMAALNRLPPDLIEAILHFLPVKSLGRFKSVSKRWYSLISSQEFIKTHIRNLIKNYPNPNPTHLILDHLDGYSTSTSTYSVDIKQLNAQPTPATLIAKRLIFQEPLFEILGSCNGLLLANDKYHNLYLVNPLTRKSLIVPDFDPSMDNSWNMYPTDETTNKFGYDSSTDDYKVISIPYNGVPDSDPDTKFARMYSLRNNSWHMLPIFSYERDIYGPGVLLNNNLHWFVDSRHSTTTTIAAFNLASEEFHEIEFPDSVNRAITSKLCALGGKLVVIVRRGEFDYESWVMKEYGVLNSWTKLCVINNDTDYDYEFFSQVSNRDILLGNNWKNEIDIYNMDERRCTSVTVEGCPERFTVSGTYVESLESVERFR